MNDKNDAVESVANEILEIKDQKNTITVKSDLQDSDLVKQMEKMEILRQEEFLPRTTPMTPESPVVTSHEVIEDISDESTESSEDYETTTTIATSISTSEAFSYFSSAAISNY